MRVLVLTALAAIAAHAADDRSLALMAGAQANFKLILADPSPSMSRASQCAQSQAMAASVAPPEQMGQLLFQKAYCEMAGASASANRAAFDEAAETFDTAIADAQAASAKQKIPTPVSPTWSILAAVSRIEAASMEGNKADNHAVAESQQQALTLGVDADTGRDSFCQSDAAMMDLCRGIRQLGSEWLGWIALGHDDLVVAQRRFANGGVPQWNNWIMGLQSFRRGDYAGAASREGSAIAQWRSGKESPLWERLAPRPEWSTALAEWGGSQFAAGNPGGAMAALDEALKADPTDARAHYIRALVEEAKGRGDAALEDFDAASRASLARGNSGEAHFYRGIVLFRRKEFVRAENEFADALSGGADTSWTVDARAWRHLAAVARGACGASREYLDKALPQATPFFPKEEARKMAAACATDAFNRSGR